MITITGYILYNPFINSKSDAQMFDIFTIDAALRFRVSALTDAEDSRRGLVKKTFYLSPPLKILWRVLDPLGLFKTFQNKILLCFPLLAET